MQNDLFLFAMDPSFLRAKTNLKPQPQPWPQEHKEKIDIGDVISEIEHQGQKP